MNGQLSIQTHIVVGAVSIGVRPAAGITFSEAGVSRFIAGLAALRPQ